MRIVLLTVAAMLAFSTPVAAQCWAPAATRSPGSTTRDALHDVRVRSFRLLAGAALSAQDQEQLEHSIAARSYEHSQVSQEIRERVRMAYQDHGYFKATVADPEVHVVGQDDRHQVVDVAVRVDPGRIYRLKEIRLTGAKAFSAEELRPALLLRPGDVFDMGKVRASLEQMLRLYRSKGYLNFVPVPDPRVDEDAGLISLQIDIDEGPVFRAGALVVQGEETAPGAKDKLRETWKRYQGAPYDGEHLLARFLQDLGACPGLRPEEIFSFTLDERAGVVNVGITLAQRPQ